MLPQGYKPRRSMVILSGVVLLLFAIYAIHYTLKRNRAFSGEVRYTVGVTNKRYWTKSGSSIIYTYEVNGIEYEESASYGYESKVPDGKYWVKYSVEYPEISKIYQNMPVDAKIDTLPPNGFKGRYDYSQFRKWKVWAAKQKSRNK